MASLPEFKLEAHFSKWEFKAKYHLCASDAQSISMRELLEMATPEDREAFEGLSLGYTEPYGATDLRKTIAGTYEQQKASNILCFCGASEGIFAANSVLMDKESHAIVVTPNYQSHEALPAAFGSVSAVSLDATNNWALDIDQVAASIKPNTRLITINFPHNPTGSILPLDRYMALINLCRQHGIYILHDEIFHGLGHAQSTHLPQIADVYERGLSLNVTSKSYGLPGLRIGWIACQDKAILSKMERMKHYLSICNSGPSEQLANIAIKNREKLLLRNCQIVDINLPKWEALFTQYPTLFDWQRPDGSCMGFPRYKGTEGVEVFTQKLVEDSGVLLLPSSIFRSTLGDTPSDRFRIGLGREGLDEGLEVMQTHIEKHKLEA